MRWELYLSIKEVTRDRPETEDGYYITKNEMKAIMNRQDMWALRQKVFDLYGIPVPNPNIDPPHEILKRAHYTYIVDIDFDQQIRQLKQEHEKYIAGMLENVPWCKTMEDYYAIDTFSNDK